LGFLLGGFKGVMFCKGNSKLVASKKNKHSFLTNQGGVFSSFLNGQKSRTLYYFFAYLCHKKSMFFSEKHPDRTVQTEHGEFLFFSGTSYLGMSTNPDFQEIIKEEISIYGTNYGSSRTSNVRLSVFEEINDFLCKWTGAEASLTMSSGFLAGQLVAQWICEMAQKNYVVSYAPYTHPAVFSGLEQASSPATTFEEWAKQISFQITKTPENYVIVANSVDVLHAKIHDFEWLRQIKLEENQEVICIIDDSHGIGITGENGSGIFSQIPSIPQVKKVVVASMGKALGLPAGMILGQKEVINHLQKSAFYSGGSPTPPAFLSAFLKGQPIYQLQMQKLKENITFFSSQISGLQLFQFPPAYPVFRTYHNPLYAYLLAHQALISSFPYPKPDSELITRVVLSSLHTQEDLGRLIALLRAFI
jgi:8-amino-7-oxononanoate synthase